MSTAFNDRIDALFQQLEDAIDDSDLDLDYENQGSVFTISMEGRAPVILNRHEASQQLWLAAQSGGYHMEYDEAASAWICTRSGKRFEQLWNDACQAQFGGLVES